jgi:CheY-like chemotaxis protein
MARRRILVVEDELVIAIDMEATLADLGHDVASVTSSADAKARLAEWRPDLVFLDYHLRDGDAGELAAYLNSVSIPFVVCSGSTGIEELGDIFAGAPFLAKPFSDAGLIAAVGRLE